MKTLAVGTVALAMAFGTTTLASGPIIPTEPAVTPPAPIRVYDWGGAYAGTSLSYGNGTAEDVSFGPGEFDLRGASLSGFAGYNVQRGALVYGAEFAVGVSSADGTDGAFMLPLQVRNSVELRGRLGYAAGRAMPYLALGVISSQFRADHEGFGLAADRASARLTGATLALGVDAMVNDRMFVRGEIQAIRYNDRDIPFYANTDPHTLRADDLRLSLGVGWNF